METIDMTPTWAGVTPVYIAALENGTDKGRIAAREELGRMARLADRYTSLHPKLPDEVRDIAASNATFAVDNFQSKGYRDRHGRDSAVAAHAQNVTDTLAEKGITGQDKAALAAYYLEVSKQLAKVERVMSKKAKAAKPEDCRWFARCDRKATGTTPHPILGEVPTCDRCHKFATGKDR